MLITIEGLTVHAPPINRDGLWAWAKMHVKRLAPAGKKPAFALKNISCTFGHGITTVLGPNGAGKTMLLAILAGLIPPDSGRTTIDGKVSGPEALRRITGYLPQTYGLYPQLNAREILDYIALLRGVVNIPNRAQRVENALQQLGLMAVAEQKVGTYSWGMRQKVGIAQTLLDDSPVLVLDEPTAGLDAEERNKLRQLLIQIGQSRVVVWASSLIADACCADRVLILDRGDIRFWGTPAELARRIQSPADPLRAAMTGMNSLGPDLLEQGYRAILQAQVNT